MQTLNPTSPSSRTARTFVILLMLGFFAVITLRAWVSDDAFITFRTADNLIHGYGLTWNPGERVLAYTHPLWMFVIAGAYALSGEVYFTAIAISLLLSCLAVALIPARLARSAPSAGFAILTLTLSNAFVDFSTSGLENPLSFLIGGAFMGLYFRARPTPRNLFWLSGLASLAALNRLDALVIYLPALLFSFWKAGKGWKALALLIAGQIPLALWEFFSLIYYGFPFPNTYYAKLTHGIPWQELLAQGGQYALESLRHDPLTLEAILTCLITTLALRRLRQDGASLALMAGVGLYLAGILHSGGDFMAGRFFALPLYFFAVLISRIDLDGAPVWLKRGAWGLMVILGLLASPPTLVPSAEKRIDEHGIANERSFYFAENGLINQFQSQLHPFFPWVREGLALRAEAEASPKKLVVVRDAIGMAGFFGGPKVTIVDPLGLSDALLARQPAADNTHWRIGHHGRAIPAGYIETIQSGENLLQDPKLAREYVNLALITQGKLFSWRRLRAIVNTNLGLDPAETR